MPAARPADVRLTNRAALGWRSLGSRCCRLGRRARRTRSSARAAAPRPGRRRRRRRSTATTRSPLPPTRSSTTATAASSPRRGNVEAWQNDHVLRADKITFDRNTNIAAATGHVVDRRAGRAGAVQRLRRADRGHARGRAAGHARAAGRERQAGRQRRPADRGQDQRAEPGRLHHLQPVQEGPRPRRRSGSCGRARPCRTRRTSASSTATRCSTSTASRSPVFPVFLARRPLRPAGERVPDPVVRQQQASSASSCQHPVLLGARRELRRDVHADPQHRPIPQPRYAIPAPLQRRHASRSISGSATTRASCRPRSSPRASSRYDDTWRYGFDINRASSADLPARLQVQQPRRRADHAALYVEGFGTGAYSRLDALAYQGLVASIEQNRLPYVLPRYDYSYLGEPDALGGRLSFDTENFNVLREHRHQHAAARRHAAWERPFAGAFGEQYNLHLADRRGRLLGDQPRPEPELLRRRPARRRPRAQPNVALEVRWPLVREGWRPADRSSRSRSWWPGPNTGGLRKQDIPNEDSLDFEFTDQNLFSINKFPGIDRQEGGCGCNAGLHLNWTAGGSARRQPDRPELPHPRATTPSRSAAGSSTAPPTSSRARRSRPASWLDLTGAHAAGPARPQPALRRRGGQRRAADRFRLNAGYIYSDVQPVLLLRHADGPAELLPAAERGHGRGDRRTTTTIRFNAYARRDVALNKMIGAGVRATYENECFIFDANVSRRYTSLNGDTGVDAGIVPNHLQDRRPVRLPRLLSCAQS